MAWSRYFLSAASFFGSLDQTVIGLRDSEILSFFFLFLSLVRFGYYLFTDRAVSEVLRSAGLPLASIR